MSRGTRSFKTHALTLFQVELHPAVDAPLEKKTSSSVRTFAKSLLPATGKNI
jgi:hypothetical protein